MDYLAPLRSALKLNILLSLLKGEKRISELRAELETSETTILHALKDLEELNLTKKSGGVYQLTSLGALEAELCSGFSSAVQTMDKFHEFWLTHDITTLPSNLVLKLGYLKDSTLVRTELAELGMVHKTFLQLLLSSKKVRGVSPFFHPDFVAAFKMLLNQGSSVELVLTKAVLNKTLSLTDAAEMKLVKEFIAENRLKFFLREDLKVALTITESGFSLGLFNRDGTYDDKMDLISFNREAIEWGEKLFEACLKDSKEVKLEDWG
ncbi:MAG: helix-turn-helix transcriptional regulator [Candidatus Bathyarchaeia archaeon]